MKNLIYIISIIICMPFVSCDNDIDVWDSETLEYAGRYTFGLYDENMEPIVPMGEELRLYNTSNNVKNEIFIDDLNLVFPIKSKLFLTGDFSSFKSSSLDFDQLADYNEYTYKTPDTPPTGADERAKLDIGYIRSVVQEGKIIPKAATSIGGNPADSIYIKITLYSGTINYKSVLIPEEYRVDPNIIYEWAFDSTARNPEKDETYIISGHRYTGFPEDHY